jgi:hypothetical protein
MGTSLKDRLTPEYIAPTPHGDVYIYRMGALCCSVCAPAALEGEDVAKAVERHSPCGTDPGWTISRDANFASGEPNPCICQEDADRRHWLLDA